MKYIWILLTIVAMAMFCIPVRAEQAEVLKAYMQDKTGINIAIFVPLVNYKEFERGKRLYREWNENSLGAFYAIVDSLLEAKLSKKVGRKYNNIKLLNQNNFPIGFKAIEVREDQSDIAWDRLFTPFKIDLSPPGKAVHREYYAERTSGRLEDFWQTTQGSHDTLNFIEGIQPQIVYMVHIERNDEKIVAIYYYVEVFKNGKLVELSKRDKRVATKVWMNWKTGHFNYDPGENVERFFVYVAND